MSAVAIYDGTMYGGRAHTMDVMDYVDIDGHWDWQVAEDGSRFKGGLAW